MLPACGQNDSYDGSDQPYLGFSSQWQIINAACSVAYGGAGLLIIPKTNLTNGLALVEGQTYYRMFDPIEGANNGPRNVPAQTYGSTINNRLYFTAAVLNQSGNYAIIYSHIEGPPTSPTLYSSTTEYNTSLAATQNFGIYVDSIGCTGCMNSETSITTHSVSVRTFHNGTPYIVSTSTAGDPRFARGTQIVSVAMPTGYGTGTALQLSGGQAGSGPLASQIAVPCSFS